MAPKCLAPKRHGAQLSDVQSAAPDQRRPNGPPPMFSTDRKSELLNVDLQLNAKNGRAAMCCFEIKWNVSFIT